MGYFPFFMEIADAPCLIVGGGRVALRKMEKLLPFGADITVVSPEFCPELAEMEGIRRICRRFQPEDIAGMRFVIGAVEDAAVNREISACCMEKNIPVNIVDDPQKCSFFFPALVKRGGLTIGISTGGASPLAAQYIRREIEGMLPAQLDGMIDFLAEQRAEIKKREPNPQKREALLRELFALALAEYAERGGLPEEEK